MARIGWARIVSVLLAVVSSPSSPRAESGGRAVVVARLAAPPGAGVTCGLEAGAMTYEVVRVESGAVPGGPLHVGQICPVGGLVVGHHYRLVLASSPPPGRAVPSAPGGGPRRWVVSATLLPPARLLGATRAEVARGAGTEGSGERADVVPSVAASTDEERRRGAGTEADLGEDLWCPRCRQRLRPAEAHGRRLAGCASCGGLFLEPKAAARLVGRLDDLEPAGPSAGRGPCPRCARPMDVLRPAGSDVEVDRCRDDGLWLDRNELERIAAHLRRKLPPARPRREVEVEAVIAAAATPPDAAAATAAAVDAASAGVLEVGAALLEGALDIVGDLLGDILFSP